MVSYANKELSLVDLETGAVQAIRGVKSSDLTLGIWSGEVTWSPDGRWIAVILGGRIVLIDATDTSRRKKLRSSGSAVVIWSPDSKHLLLSISQWSCIAYLFFESLEVIDIETGKRRVIKSSHCEVGGGWPGWLDSDAVR